MLHLEDSPLDAELASARLSRAQIACEIERVDTREGFCIALQSRRFDVILSDFAIPDFDGMAALDIARKLSPDTPFLFFSGQLGEELAIETLKRGATDYVLKQRLDRLAPAVERALAEARERSNLRRTEEELRVQNSVTRTITDNATACLFMTDMEGRVTFMNPAAERVSGYAFTELDGVSLHSAMHPVHPDGTAYPVEECPLDKAYLEHLRIVGHEDFFARKDGAFYPVVCAASPIMKDGVRAGTVVEVRDVTEEKRAEQALKQHQEDIEGLNNRLRQSMIETHHRVKNNLQLVVAMIDIQTMNGLETVPVEEFNRLSRQVSALAAVHDLLTTAAKGDGQAHALPAGALIRRLLPMLQLVTASRKIRYEVRADTRISTRQATSLALVINELVANSLKHTSGAVNVIFDVLEDEAMLTVSDEGAGFPGQFDPKKSASTGLDLVENLVRWDLGGMANYGNGSNGGAKVLVTFPLLEDLEPTSV